MSALVWICILFVVVVPFFLAPGPAAALPLELCCRLGNPGCCFFLLIELWWDGYIEFPGPDIG
jgi:hypothetical protein